MPATPAVRQLRKKVGAKALSIVIDDRAIVDGLDLLGELSFVRPNCVRMKPGDLLSATTRWIE